MKKTRILYFLTLLMCVFLNEACSDCHGDPDEVSVGMSSINLSASGGSQSIPVASNTKWTVSGNHSWLTVAPMQGSKNGAFSISASENTSKESRNCMLIITAGDASTMVSINQSGKTQSNQIVITNGSTYTLSRFRVVFMNSRLEELTDRDFGTFDPGTVVTADIPTSAKEFYMATYMNNKWYFSPNYDVTYTDLRLTTAEIGNWSTNSSANQYPQATSED